MCVYECMYMCACMRVYWMFLNDVSLIRVQILDKLYLHVSACTFVHLCMCVCVCDTRVPAHILARGHSYQLCLFYGHSSAYNQTCIRSYTYNISLYIGICSKQSFVHIRMYVCIYVHICLQTPNVISLIAISCM